MKEQFELIHVGDSLGSHVFAVVNLLDSGALCGDELVAALMHHTHAHLTLIALLAKAPGEKRTLLW